MSHDMNDTRCDMYEIYATYVVGNDMILLLRGRVRGILYCHPWECGRLALPSPKCLVLLAGILIPKSRQRQ